MTQVEQKNEDSESSAVRLTPDGMATAAAEFTSRCMFHWHRGVIDCGDKVVIFGNDGYELGNTAEREVQLIREYIETTGLHADGFGLDSSGYSWAVVATNYSRVSVDIPKLETAVNECFSTA